MVVNSGAGGDISRNRCDDVPRMSSSHDEVVPEAHREKAVWKAPGEALKIPRARTGRDSGRGAQ